MIRWINPIGCYLFNSTNKNKRVETKKLKKSWRKRKCYDEKKKKRIKVTRRRGGWGRWSKRRRWRSHLHKGWCRMILSTWIMRAQILRVVLNRKKNNRKTNNLSRSILVIRWRKRLHFVFSTLCKIPGIIFSRWPKSELTALSINNFTNILLPLLPTWIYKLC